MLMKTAIVLAIALSALPGIGVGDAVAASLPAPCREVAFEQTGFVACAVDPEVYFIRLFLDGSDGRPYGSLEAFAADGPLVVFAMNAGMYLPDAAPQGLYIEQGEVLTPLEISEGDTNFYLKPNGVFAINTSGRATVIASDAFTVEADVAFATQSGPMLVIDGSLHPRFAENGTSLYVRNGVGVRADGTVVFAISLTPVSFGRFARLFRDALGCPNALYLDGFVSGLADSDGMVVGGGHLAGPIVAVMER
jgi:uncharacterized protein YigE (DUF2233 family)